MSRILTRWSRHGQRGYTLVELIVGLTLSGMLATAVTVFALQTMKVSDTSGDRMQALMQVENAGFWMGRDVQMSENVTLGQSAGFPLRLVWEDSDNNTFEVTYSLDGTDLNRTLVENGGDPARVLIARDVATAPSSTNVTRSGGMVVFSVTSNSGDVDVSHTYTIQPRLALLSTN